MDRNKALQCAIKNISDEQRAILYAKSRKGITEEEMKNLKEKLEYARYVFRLIERDEDEKI